MFRLPGIFRTVALRSTPKLQIYNINVVGDLSEDPTTAHIRIDAAIRNFTTKKANKLHLRYKVYECELYSDQVKKVDALEGASLIETAAPGEITQNKLAILAKNIKAWSAEEPHRYVLVAQLTDKKGKVIETVSSYFGFTKVEIKDTPADKDEFGKAGRYFYVNGKPVKFKGVNRHE